MNYQTKKLIILIVIFLVPIISLADDTKETKWHEETIKIVALPTAILGLASMILLIIKSLLESKKVKLEIRKILLDQVVQPDLNTKIKNILIADNLNHKLIRDIKNFYKGEMIEISQKIELKKELQQLYFESIFWKLNYLGLYFDSFTKLVLLWFSKFSNQSTIVFEENWKSVIPDSQKRDSIIEELIQYDMLEKDSVNIRITSLGHFFLQFFNINLMKSNE